MKLILAAILLFASSAIANDFYEPAYGRRCDCCCQRPIEWPPHHGNRPYWPGGLFYQLPNGTMRAVDVNGWYPPQLPYGAVVVGSYPPSPVKLTSQKPPVIRVIQNMGLPGHPFQYVPTSAY